jgi:hypothetical protein
MAMRKELRAAVAERYRSVDRAEKARIVNDFVKITGFHRKHAMGLLRGSDESRTGRRARRRIYGQAERNALALLWEASDRVCGKRLKALLPTLIEAMDRHGHLDLAAEVRGKLLSFESSDVDRALGQIREELGRQRRRPAAHPCGAVFGYGRPRIGMIRCRD